MKKLVVAFVALSSALAMAGEPLVFSDSFDGGDSGTLPPPWMESNETEGGPGEACVGINQIAVNAGELVFDTNSGGCDPASAYYQNAVATVPLDLAMGEGSSFALFYDFGVPMGDYAYLSGLSSMTAGPCAMPNVAALSSATVPCDGLVIRLSSSSSMPTAKTSATGSRRAFVPSGGQYLTVEIGPVGEGGFMGFFGGMSAMPVVPGTVVNVAMTVNPFDGINVMVTIPDQPPVMVTVGGAGASKRLTKALPSIDVSGTLLYFADADYGYPLSDSSTFSTLAATVGRFDNIAVYGESAIIEPINARVAARGKFKKAPINIKTKGKVQATVFGGDFDLSSIDWSSVRFGASGSENSVAASGPPTYAHVDKDGELDAIFTFNKSAAATPCGTTSITVSGTLGGGRPEKQTSTRAVPGAQPFSGSDSVKITGCPAPRRR